MVELLVVKCPCCQAELHVDSETSAVIRHQEHVKPPTITDMEEAVQKLKAEPGRREEIFKKSVKEQKSHSDVLNKKFDEMLKIAKEHPDDPPPKRDIDFD